MIKKKILHRSTTAKQMTNIGNIVEEEKTKLQHEPLYVTAQCWSGSVMRRASIEALRFTRALRKTLGSALNVS